MANFFDMACPACGQDDRIDIEATLWVRVTPDGTDADASEDGTHDYEDDSLAECQACGYGGKVREFKTE